MSVDWRFSICPRPCIAVMASSTEDFAKYFQAVFIPKQRAPPDPLPEGIVMASVSTYPPLGQVTQLKTGDVNFVAVLDVDESDASSHRPWEVAIWYTDGANGSQEWVEYQLNATDSRRSPSDLQTAQTTSRLYYGAKLSIKSQLEFTAKFRSGPDQQWRWIRDEAGMGDGLVVVNDSLDRKDTQSKLPDLIQGLNPDFKWKPLTSQSPGTRLWSIEAPVDAAQDEESKVIDLTLGTPWGNFLR